MNSSDTPQEQLKARNFFDWFISPLTFKECLIFTQGVKVKAEIFISLILCFNFTRRMKLVNLLMLCSSLKWNF